MVFQKKDDSSIDMSCLVRNEIPIRLPTKVYLIIISFSHHYMATASDESRYFGFATNRSSSFPFSSCELGHGMNKSIRSLNRSSTLQLILLFLPYHRSIVSRYNPPQSKPCSPLYFTERRRSRASRGARITSTLYFLICRKSWANVH